MNIQEYIESGLLEAYILGALPEQERLEVEVAIAKHPELKQELAAIEEAMLRFAEATAVQPPAGLHDKIWEKLAEQEIIVPHEHKHRRRRQRTLSPLRSWQYAAIWIVLAGSLLVNLLLYSERNKTKSGIAALQQQVNNLTEIQKKMVSENAAFRNERSMLADVGIKSVLMQTAQTGRPMAGMVYWSKAKGEAYVSMLNMPMPPKGMQYQFWVIKDGVPINMGMIPNDMVSGGLQKITGAITGGQAFAISLEKEGGNPTPTEVMVMGAIAS